ncbi:type II toxin-antitoxin system HipA family toxin [Pseudidiomarina sediminum]|uniref:Type II toxin-antitoxin system HipA family toxin n=2 Tax=Pseudidiomarina sediminum TaxID=431675 RepID=A0A432Z3T6_9GAMM|nr:type II toxin-antitoxin system HipA family toxin [Pseudidiomarina sediminum]RUO72546.1 type II toxin-antitoxin system HipA family toxin [Pseudidiomarina sediminum]
MVAKVCTVEFDGFRVGALAQADDSVVVEFEYAPEWLAEGFAIDPIHLPLQAGVFRFPELAYPTFKGLPAVFADSLPDDFGNALIDAWLARKGLDAEQFTALDRLLYTGTRGMGALEYQPAQQLNSETLFEVDLADLVKLAQSVLDERTAFATQTTDDDAMVNLIQVGTSAGGARPKAVIAINSARDHILSGQVAAPAGYEHYLLKFDGVEEHRHGVQTFGDPKGFGLMEYVYYLMASQCGIEMNPCELLREGDRAHFMTKRFDREHNQKYHVMTLCAMAHADYKKPGHFSYEQLFAVARQLGLTHQEQLQLFRRMVFNVVARNHDDHTKNTAFYVDDNFEWALAPAYDMAWSYKPSSDWVAKHQLALNGKRDDFELADLLAIAELISNFSRREAMQVIQDIVAVVRTWPELAQREGVPQALLESVTASHRLYLI